jgi:uncharacterized protein (TIGR02757 family)
VGFLAASLAFGRLGSVLNSIERVLAIAGPEPAAYVKRFEPATDGGAFRGVVHRWTRGPDLVALLWVMRQMLDRAGSIEQFFLEGDDRSSRDVGPAIDSFSRRALALDLEAVYGRRSSPRSARPPGRLAAAARPLGVRYFFPRASAGSGCKRLNLFLRWMVRRDALDLGVWRHVAPSRLIIPLDTHVVRVGQCLGLTRYASPGWRMAEDMTASLRRLDPDDPVKYDFSLCHLGMMNACGFDRASPGRPATRTPLNLHCPLRGVCQPHGRRPRPSLRPSARR